MRSNRLRLPVLVLTAGLLAGCAEKEGSGADGGQASAPQVVKSCGAHARINAGMNRIVANTEALQTDQYDPAQVAEALPGIQADYDQLVAPAVADFKEDAPVEISADVEDLADKLQRFRDEGDTTLFSEQPAMALDAFYYQQCPGTKSDISGVEYEFKGSAKFRPGPARFKLTNEGQEFHHMVVFAKRAGVESSFDELLALPGGEWGDKLQVVTGSGPIAPGDTTYLTGTLEQGSYAMVCFIAEGATPESVGAGGEMFSENGPSHLSLGMKKEFTVF